MADRDDEMRDDEIRDALPSELDATGFVGPYTFPDNSRRRIQGWLYLVVAVACAGVWLALGGGVMVNEGFLVLAIGLGAFGAYCMFAGMPLGIDETDALVAVTKLVVFPVGHASAQLGWRGLGSRPTWRILVYSAEEPPATRGLVLIDGVDGSVVEYFLEDNPEDPSDWNELASS